MKRSGWATRFSPLLLMPRLPAKYKHFLMAIESLRVTTHQPTPLKFSFLRKHRKIKGWLEIER